MVEDFNFFFGDFSQTVTLQLKLEDRDVQALFFNSSTEIYQLDQVNTDGPPCLLVQTADTIDFNKDCKVSIDEMIYNILGIEPDGTGFTKITLEKDV